MPSGLSKVDGILKVRDLGLPTPPTVFVSDYEADKNQLNNFMLGKDYVMIRSDHQKDSAHCPRNLKCKVYEAKDFIKKLNSDGFVAIVQPYVPLNNRYSGNILMLNNSFIIEAMRGGPVSKLNREGVMHQHLRISRQGQIIQSIGESVIPGKEVEMIINKVKDLPLKHHIIEFSSGPNWFYFWHAREDLTSELLEF